MMNNLIKKPALSSLIIVFSLILIAGVVLPYSTIAQSVPQCADGIDNDGDGLIDSSDTGCTNANDNSEYNTSGFIAQCSDGIDNDGDGRVDMSDPGCTDSNDNSEFDYAQSATQCSDGIDNDGDGLVDLADSGCTNSSDNSEYNAAGFTEQCADGVDNDGDGRVDMSDPGCSSSADNSEFEYAQSATQCSDGIDNDADGLVDANDPGCTSSVDNSEFNQVNNPTPGQNRAPICTQSSAQYVYVGNNLSMNVSAVDPDSNTLSYTAINLPAGATFTGTTFSWTPTAIQVGSFYLQFRASDGTLTCDISLPVTVLNNSQSQPNNPNPYYNYNYNSYSYGSSGYQPYYMGGLSYYSMANGQYNYSGNTGYYGTGQTQYNNVYNAGYSNTYGYGQGVGNQNRAPVWLTYVTNQQQNAMVNQQLYFSVLANDPDGDPVSYSAFNLPAGASFNAIERSFSWVPSNSQVGTYQVTFRASDPHSNISDLTVTIMVGASTNTVVATYNVPNYTTTYTPVRPAVLGIAVAATSKLEITNISADKGGENECAVYVAWDTNIPATGKVLYGLTSQIDKTSGFKYDKETPETLAKFTRNKVNLGCLEIGKTYYFRIIAKAGDESVVSRERILIPLASGALAEGGTASAFDVFGGIFNPWLLLAIVSGVLAFLFWRSRKDEKEEATAQLHPELHVPNVGGNSH